MLAIGDDVPTTHTDLPTTAALLLASYPLIDVIASLLGSTFADARVLAINAAVSALIARAPVAQAADPAKLQDWEEKDAREDFDRRRLDAEQAFRVRSILRAISDNLREDSSERVALWLSGDPTIWIAMLDRELPLIHRGINPRVRQPERHRRVVKHDRRRCRGLICLHAFPRCDARFGRGITAAARTIQRAVLAKARLGLVGWGPCDSPTI